MEILNSQFSILNSQFSILNSQFSILNSQFSILNSQFSDFPLKRFNLHSKYIFSKQDKFCLKKFWRCQKNMCINEKGVENEKQV
jgi:hypothetical protein